MVDKSIVESVRRYLRSLIERGLEPSFGVVFGSQVTGRTHEWSDIDLVVVAKRFDESRDYENSALLWRVAGRVDPRIEPIPCGEIQWREDERTPIFEVARREGVVVKLDE
jgi:predicted nucleotidyltransferase